MKGYVKGVVGRLDPLNCERMDRLDEERYEEWCCWQRKLIVEEIEWLVECGRMRKYGRMD